MEQRVGDFGATGEDARRTSRWDSGAMTKGAAG